MLTQGRMIMKLRVWDKHAQKMRELVLIDFKDKQLLVGPPNSNGEYDIPELEEVELMLSTNFTDKNKREVYKDDIIKFRDWWVKKGLVELDILVKWLRLR